MRIIELTKLKFKIINPTKTGDDNYELEKTEKILINTNCITTIKTSEAGGIYGSMIEFSKGSVSDYMRVKESIQEIKNLL